MSEVHYGKRWFRAKKQLFQPWDEAQARAAHEVRTPYTAVIGDPKRPRAFLEVSGELKYVGVEFLDGQLREVLTYQFKEVEPGKLFLTMATLREFDGNRDQVLAGTSYIFEEDGRLTIRKEWFRPHGLDLRETTADVSANYDRYPEFGAYDSLCRDERISLEG